MPQLKAAVPLKNRKHFDTHSVFLLAGQQDVLETIYVHHRKDKGKASFSLIPRGRVLTVVMNTEEYHKLWTDIWNASNPGLIIDLEQDKVASIKATDLAK